MFKSHRYISFLSNFPVRSFLVVFVLVVLGTIAWFRTLAVNAITPIATTSSATGATQSSTQRHLVRTTDGTLHMFVQMGTNTSKCGSGGLWWLRSTDDGATWTCPAGTQVSTSTTNLMYADARVDSNNNIYLVYSMATTGRADVNDVLYRKISYNGSTWTLESAQTVLDGTLAGTGYHYATIELEGNTRIWLASRTFNGTNYDITTYYSDSQGNAPTWTVSQAAMDPFPSNNASYHYPTLVRAGTKIGLIYNINNGASGDLGWRYRDDATSDPTSWTSNATISTTYFVRQPSFSAVGDTTGNIYLAASGSTASQALFSYYSATSSTWTSPATISSTAVGDQFISVSTDGNSAWVLYGEGSGVTGGTNKRLAYKKIVTPFATANVDTNPTYVVDYHGIFNKVWLYDNSSNTFQEETTDAGTTTTADVLHSDSGSIIENEGDIIYFGKSTTFDSLSWVSSTVGSGGTVSLAWEYCSAVDISSVCTTWSTQSLTATSTQPNMYTATTGYVSFTPNGSWQASKVNGEGTAYYYLRARIPTGQNYTTNGPIGTQYFAIPPIAWGSLANSTVGLYGVWTENTNTAMKIRYDTMYIHPASPYVPTSLGGHVAGNHTLDTTPTLTFTLDDPSESDQVKYRIQIDDTADFSSPVVDYTSGLGSQGSAIFTVGQAVGSGTYTIGAGDQTLPNASYYWRVKAIDNNNEESEYATANSGAVAFIVDTTTWPMAGANPERTSWTSQTLPGSIATQWVKPIEPLVSQKVQVIGAEGNVYVSTANGLYAFNADSGAEEWVYPTELPLGHSPTYSDGILYVGGMDRRIHAVDAETGAGVWTYEATGGFSTSPVIANGKVYAGNRDGKFYAINTADGTLAWSYQTDNQILQSAAYKPEDDGIPSTGMGTLFFASNDGYAYALDAEDGSLVWKSSSKLPSNGFYSWWPVIYQDDVIFTRTTFGSGHTGEETNYLLCDRTTGGSRPFSCTTNTSMTTGAVGAVAGPWVNGTATLNLNSNPQNGFTFADYFETFPEYRNHIYYNMVSGTERNFDIDGDTITDAAPVGWSGDGGTPAPPIVSGYDDVIYFRTYTRGTTSGFGSKTIGGWNVGTGIISVPYSNDNGQSGGWPGDEPFGMTAAGNKIYWNGCCDRFVGAVDISQPNTNFLLNTDDTNRQWRYITSGGIPSFPFSNIGMPSDYYTSAIPYFWDPLHSPAYPGVFWNENDKVGPAVYNGKLYTILGNALVAIGQGGLGSSAPKLSEAATQTAPSLTSSITRTALTSTLEQEVQAVVNAGHLKPSYISSGGITGQNSRNIDDYLSHYWHNPADNHRILLRALPFLSSGLQDSVKTYLQNEITSYSPATYAHIGFVSGTQRDPYPYPPPETPFTSFTIPSLDKQFGSNFNNFWSFPPHNVYALWKYAEAGLGNPATLLAAWGNKIDPDIEDNFPNAINGQTVNSSNVRDFLSRFPLIANAYIAGYKGYVELARLAGQPYAAYESELNILLQWRAEDLTAFPDPDNVVGTGGYVCDNECYYESLITYYNFAHMTPELVEYLVNNDMDPGDPGYDADKDIEAIVQEYRNIAPYWMMTHNSETQGESAIQPYQQTYSLFQARAQVEGATFEELVKDLDTPIVPVGDLYYIDNLVATLETDPPADTIAPVIFLTALSPDPNNDNTPTLSGTATDASGTVSTVEFQMDSTAGAWTACTASDGSFNSASEAFTCTATTLSDGSHTMNVRATDSNGNTTANGSVSTDTFTIDTNNPSVSLTPISPDPGTDTTPTISGTASDATNVLTSIEFQVDSIVGSWTACTADDSTIDEISETFTCTTSALSDGSHTIYVRATDNVNNTSVNASDIFVIDTTAPTTPGTPSTTTPTSDTTPTWNWTASTDATSGLANTPYTVQWSQTADFSSGVSSSTSTTNSFTHSTPLADGTWYFRVKAVDLAGNESSYSSNGSVVIDTSTPTPTPTPSPTPTPTPTPTVEPTPTVTPTPSPTTPPSECTQSAPGNAPSLYAAIPRSATSIMLQFTAANDPVDYYALEYGTESGVYTWSATNIGNRDTRRYLVKSLSPNTTYYFRVRAGNGCATGAWSNEISATTLENVAFSELLITESIFENADTSNTESETDTNTNTYSGCQEYTVKPGDNLWNIANELLDDGGKYQELIDQNKDTYSSLASSSNLKLGWILSYNCNEKQDESNNNEVQLDGYEINVRVVDDAGNPVKGARVTMHSKIQEAVTDSNGVARFTNVEPGAHRVIIAYDGFEGEQALHVDGDVKEYNLNVTVRQEQITFSPVAWIIIGIMGVIIFVLIFLLVRTKEMAK